MADTGGLGDIFGNDTDTTTPNQNSAKTDSNTGGFASHGGSGTQQSSKKTDTTKKEKDSGKAPAFSVQKTTDVSTGKTQTKTQAKTFTGQKNKTDPKNTNNVQKDQKQESEPKKEESEKKENKKAKSTSQETIPSSQAQEKDVIQKEKDIAPIQTDTVQANSGPSKEPTKNQPTREKKNTDNQEVATPSVQIDIDQNTLQKPSSAGSTKEETTGEETTLDIKDIQKQPIISSKEKENMKKRKPKLKKKKNKKAIDTKKLVFGCGFFLLLITGIISGGLYFFTQNPDQISIMKVETIKSLLKVFSVIFFGFLFLIGFSVTILNTHRVTVTKNKKKGGYIIGILIGLILLLTSLVGGFYILHHVSQLTDEEALTSQQLVIPSIPLKRGYQEAHRLPNIPLIAPMNITFALNPDVVGKVLSESIGNATIQKVELDCDNGKTLPLSTDGKHFAGSCLYEKKGEYTLATTFHYLDPQTNSPKTAIFRQGFYFASEISLETSQGPYTHNDDETEIMIGKAPQKVFLDASKIFSDLGIGTYKMSRDIDADGSFDIIDDVEFAHIYTQPQLQTVYYTLPQLQGYTYPLLFRVEQSDVPICTLTGSVIKNTTFDISAHCSEQNGPIVSYNYTILKKRRNGDYEEVESINADSNSLRYTFPTKGDYLVKMKFLTQEDKKGYAESNLIHVGDIDFKANYTINYIGSEEEERTRLGEKGKHIFDREKGEITLKSLPITIQLDIVSIDPVLKNTQKFVYFNDKPILVKDEKEQTYEIRIRDDQQHTLKLRVVNEENEAETIYEIPIYIDQPDIKGSLKVYPDSVGETPFIVTLDASSTTLTDPEDEIVYFSRNFDDGQKNKNTNQGNIEHEYTYNKQIDNGTYNPTVTVKTKKGLEETIALEKPIMVKKPLLKAMIAIDSHPGQLANVKDQVTFSLRTDGNPDTIERDFGDGETLEFQGRAGTEVKHTYLAAGTYKVSAKIIYDNKTTSYPTIKIIIDEE